MVDDGVGFDFRWCSMGFGRAEPSAKNGESLRSSDTLLADSISTADYSVHESSIDPVSERQLRLLWNEHQSTLHINLSFVVNSGVVILSRAGRDQQVVEGRFTSLQTQQSFVRYLSRWRGRFVWDATCPILVLLFGPSVLFKLTRSTSYMLIVTCWIRVVPSWLHPTGGPLLLTSSASCPLCHARAFNYLALHAASSLFNCLHLQVLGPNQTLRR